MDVNAQIGRNHAGLQPAVVLSSTLGCQHDNDVVLVYPCTTRDCGLPQHPAVSELNQPTVVLCDHITSLS